MTNLEDINFFVVDVETTGADNKTDRLTDIAVVQVLNGEIIDTFSSLVNPKRNIPIFIQEMTGITDEMVKSAPNEKEVLSEYNSFINKPHSLFVAHNANFDYYFIRNSMMRIFDKFIESDILCTVKLSRKLLPKSQKVNLTSLTEHFNIPVFMRHRALGDAFATARVLIRMLEILKLEHNIATIEQLRDFKRRSRKRYKIKNSRKSILLEKITQMPDCQGVFYLYDKNNVRIHQDYSDNIKVKLMSYFDPNCLCSEKLKKILDKTFDFEFTDTQSKLHSKLILSNSISEKPLSLFDPIENQQKPENIVYIDPNNNRGKTVSIYLIKDGLLADHIDFGKSANTNIIESIIDAVYTNGYEPKSYTNPYTDRVIVRKWLSQEPDLGNKFTINNNEEIPFNAIKNYIRSCY